MFIHFLSESLCILLSAWMIIGLIGAFIFILIQLILLIDFAHGWSESWVEKYEETESKCYYFGMFTPARISCALQNWLQCTEFIL